MLNIVPISAFSDNYIWLLYDENSREAFVVDPGDAAPVEATLKEM
jgi:hydroxyacylglutathione hydrolase